MDENKEPRSKEEIQAEMHELTTRLADLTHEIMMVEKFGLVRIQVVITNAFGVASVSTNVQTGLDGAMENPGKLAEAIKGVASEIGIPLPADLEEQCSKEIDAIKSGEQPPDAEREVNEVLQMLRKNMN